MIENVLNNVVTFISTEITEKDILHSEQVLIDNGIDPDEVGLVLQSIGYTLLGTELYPEEA